MAQAASSSLPSTVMAVGSVRGADNTDGRLSGNPQFRAGAGAGSRASSASRAGAGRIMLDNTALSLFYNQFLSHSAVPQQDGRSAKVGFVCSL